MNKGVSSLAASILLVLLTISVVSGAWVFYDAFQKGKTAKQGIIYQAGTHVSLEQASGNLLTVKNAGQDELTSFSIYVDDRPIEFLQPPLTLRSGESQQLVAERGLNIGAHRVKVVVNKALAQDIIGSRGVPPSNFKWKRVAVVEAEKQVKNQWAVEEGVYLNLPHKVRELVLVDDQNMEVPTAIKTSWWNFDWRFRKSITLRENAGVARTNEPVEIPIFNISESSCRELRLVSEGGEASFQLLKTEAGEDCRILFLTNLEPWGQKNYFLYYGASVRQGPSFNTDLKYSTNSTESCMENQHIRLCLPKGEGASINFLGADSTGFQNILGVQVGPTSYYSGIQPQAEYAEGWDYQACGKYTYDNSRLIVDGPIKKILEYNFHIGCAATTYSYRYVISLFAGDNGYELEVDNLSPLSFGEPFKNSIPSTNFIETPKTQTVADGQWSAYWSEDEPSSWATGVVVRYLHLQAIGGFIRPTNLMVFGGEAIEPSVLSKTRTILYSSALGASETENEWRAVSSPITYEISAAEASPENTELWLNFPVSSGPNERREFSLLYTDENLKLSKTSVPALTTAEGVHVSFGGEEDNK